jgi:hypothetical protein
MDEVVVLHFAPMLYVHYDAWRIWVFGMEHPIQERLHVFDKFAVLAEEALFFGRVDLECEAVGRLEFLNLEGKIEVPQHRI